MNLSLFLSGDHPRNAWIKERDMEIYVRKSIRLIGKEMIPCLDIGSVEVNEKHRGIGIFTSFLHRFEEEAKKLDRWVFIESILEKRFQSFLLVEGYAYVPNTSELSPNMYKIP